MLVRILLVVIAGFALAATFEPLAWGWLLPIAVALLLVSMHGVSLRGGLLLGWIFGLVFIPTLIFWMRVVAWDALIALGGFQTLYYALLGGALAVVSHLRYWPLWSAAAWVGIDAFRGSWPMSGFTWGQLGFASLDTPYAGWLTWIGVAGVSLVIALSGATVAWVVIYVASARVAEVSARRTGLVATGVLVATAAAVVLPGLVDWRGTDRGEMTVGVVQGDVPGDGTNVVAHHREITASHQRLTEELAGRVRAGEVDQPDFVAWPENSTAVDPFTDEEARQRIESAVGAVDVPILVGAVVDPPEGDRVLNQGIVMDPEFGGGDRYSKRHPVPFGEYIPYRDRIEKWQFSRLDEVPRDMYAGDRATPLQVAGKQVANAICFDVTYDDVFVDQVGRDAELIVVQTSNAMFIQTAQIDQQFAISKIRAIETGRAVVVASINGQSGVIGPDGEVIADIDPHAAEAIVAEVPLVGGVPPSMVLGPWFGRISLLVTLLALLWGALTYRRSKKSRRQRSSSAVSEPERQQA